MSAAARDDDAKIAVGSPVIKAAAAFVALGGLFTSAVGLQIIVATDWYSSPLVRALPWAEVVVGVGAIVLAAQVYRARTWSAVAAALLSLLGLVGMTGWLVLSLSWGVFSPFALIAVGTWLLAAALSLVAVPAARRATAARDRMRDAGEDLGL